MRCTHGTFGYCELTAWGSDAKAKLVDTPPPPGSDRRRGYVHLERRDKRGLKWGRRCLKKSELSLQRAQTHLNFMPTQPALAPFKKELAEYKTGKDTIQFPYDKPLPKALIRKIAAYRVRQVREKDARWMY
jgi:hypothetical protein